MRCCAHDGVSIESSRCRMTGMGDGVKFLVSRAWFHSYQSWGSAEVTSSKFRFLVYKMEGSMSEKSGWLKVLAAKPTNLTL